MQSVCERVNEACEFEKIKVKRNKISKIYYFSTTVLLFFNFFVLKFLMHEI